VDAIEPCALGARYGLTQTEEGKAVFRALSRVCLAVESELSNSLSEAQKSQLDRLLNELDKASASIVVRGLQAIVEGDDGDERKEVVRAI
jgi:hypothetical protein